jgi:hypothetical protein
MTAVDCRHPNGVVLRLHEWIDGPLGVKSSRPIGAPVPLKHGRNEVDDKFWSEWLEQNKDCSFLSADTPKVDMTQAPAQEQVRSQEGAAEEAT